MLHTVVRICGRFFCCAFAPQLRRISRVRVDCVYFFGSAYLKPSIVMVMLLGLPEIVNGKVFGFYRHVLSISQSKIASTWGGQSTM